MSAARPRWLLAGLLATVSGCAQSSPMLSQRTTVGSLKASLSHMEYENKQLRREVAALKDENREIENRLVQEESLNGDISARLDDARTLLGGRGLAGADDHGSNALDPGPGRQTLPAGQSNRKRRKTPFAQIPGRIDVLPPTDEAPASDPGTGWGSPARPSRNDPGPTGQLDRPTLWLPVARGTTDPTTPRR